MMGRKMSRHVEEVSEEDRLTLKRAQSLTKRHTLLAFTMCLMLACGALAGCGKKTGDVGSNNGDNSGAAIEAEIPEVHQFDSGMSQAHYISAPSFDGGKL